MISVGCWDRNASLFRYHQDGLPTTKIKLTAKMLAILVLTSLSHLQITNDSNPLDCVSYINEDFGGRSRYGLRNQTCFLGKINVLLNFYDEQFSYM